jgi:hypothetical protein
MIQLQTHDEALMWSRFGRMAAVMGCAILAVVFDLMIAYFTGNKPNWIATAIISIVGQLLVLKCWMDLALKRQPGKNCWEFERRKR